MNYFVLFILALLVAFAIYRLTRREMPDVIFNRDGPIADVMNKMTTILKPYAPTPWLVGPHVSTIWAMRFRPRRAPKSRRDKRILPDGGTIYFDWYEPPGCTEETPILVIVHTLAGGTREPCTNNMALAGYKNGFRVVVANQRGCSGSPYTSKALFTGATYEDIQFIVDIARNEFRPSHVFMVGFSLGGMQIGRFIKYGHGIDAYAMISNPHAAHKASHHLEVPINRQVYLKIILQQLKKHIKKAGFDNPEALKADTLAKFDDAFTGPYLGVGGHKGYYDLIETKDKIPLLKQPMLVINAYNDPFIEDGYIPIDEIKSSEYAAFVGTKEGGHVGFIEGIKGQDSYAEKVVLDFFDCVSLTQ